MQNNANDISITILETPDDIKQNYDLLNAHHKRTKNWYKRAMNTVLVLFVTAVICTAAMGVLSIIIKSAFMSVIYFCLTAIYLLAGALIIKKRKMTAKNRPELFVKARMEEYSNGFYPVSYRFTENEITSDTPYRSSSGKYKNFSAVKEFAEGLFIQASSPDAGRNIWIPARFISKNDAKTLTDMLKEKFGKKYVTVTDICLPEKAVQVQREGLLQPKGEKIMTINLEYKKANVIKGIARSIFQRTKMGFLALILLFVSFSSGGFFRQIYNTVKMIIKVVRLAAKYTQLGQVISQADAADTALNLLNTLTGLVFSVMVLLLMAVIAASIVVHIKNVLCGYNASKAWIEGEKSIDIYDDMLVSSSPVSKYIMPWSDVQKAVQNKDRVEIYDNRLRYIIIPLYLIKEQKNQLFDMLTARLSKGWNRSAALPQTSQNAVYKADNYNSRAE